MLIDKSEAQHTLGSGEHSDLPSITDFRIISVLSKGGFSQVLLARKKKTGDVYAIKVNVAQQAHTNPYF